MKIKVAKPDLEAALQVVSVGAASSGSDLTTHFVFRRRADDMIEVLSNNNRLGCSMPVAGCEVSGSDENNAFTVEAWRLNKWLAAADDTVLSLEFDGSCVKATNSQGTVKFSSLDPSQFPYWDDMLSSIQGSYKIKAKRLHSALSHVRLFISDKDTTTPKLAVTELRNESLQATDGAALTVISFPDLTSSNMRVHGRDLGQVLTFLSGCGDEEVEVKEHDRCLFFIRNDGGVLSVGRPHHAFPDVVLDKKEHDPHWWVVKASDLTRAINSLASSASKEDTRLNFNLKDGMVALSMTSAPADRVTLHLEALETGSSEEASVAMPENGFDLSYPYLLKLLNKMKSETVKFGLNPHVDKTGKQEGGWVRFREDRDGDDYLTILVWLK